MTRDQEMITKGVSVRYNEYWHSRGNSSATPLLLEDDDDVGLSDVEEAVQVKMEMK